MMLDEGGYGGIEDIKMHMAQWSKLNEVSFPKREMAEKIINATKGVELEQEFDFTITETTEEGIPAFYVWYKSTENPAL